MSDAHQLAQDPFGFLGSSFTFRSSQEQIRRNLTLIIRIRWFVSPSILLIMVLAGLIGVANQFTFSVEQIAINGVNVLIMLMLNLCYTILARRVEDLGPLVVLQLMIDVIHFAFTVYKTGTVTSPFTFLFFFVIFSGALLVSGRTAYFIAGISSFLYGAIVLLERIGVIPHQAYFSPLSGLQENPSYFFLSVGFTVGSMFAFAALAAFLTGLIHRRQEELRKTVRLLREKNDTMLMLFRTAEAFNQHIRIEEVGEYVLDQLMEHLDLDRALLYLVEGDVLRLLLVRTRGGRTDDSVTLEIPLAIEAGLTARVAIEQKAFNVREPEQSGLINRELAKKVGLNPFAIAPLVLRGRTVGVIGIDRSNNSIKSEEFQVLKAFANQAAIAIDSVRRVATSERP
ncbi:MAG: GAF domain-containing protein [Spirochaetales bacterium]|nr:GAF domain-containing protein [Spirochaetales bacterium]